MNVQAFIDNISFPMTLEELGRFADWFNVEEILNVAETEWTAPRWAVEGDIVFFFHAKTAIQKITMLETKLKQEKTEYSEEDYQWLWKSLQRARELYKSYGGKIFAIGRVSGRTEYDSQEGDEVLHWASRFYAPIDRIFVLQQPIDISEFSDFLPVSTRGATTPVVGSDFDRLKKIICAKNEIPDYLKKSRAIPLPLQKINPENWLDVTQEYRKELLDDVIVENRQAIEMTTIYRDIINGTRELMSSLLDNRLNNVMKYLTSITIVMAIPTVISGIYGMNVNENWMPFANTPHGFLIICIITLLICIITMLFLRKKKML